MTRLENTPLLTDLYQLTMLEAYFEEDMEDCAVFEFFVRRLPENRKFLIAAGLEQVVQYLEQLHFDSDEIEFLREQKTFGSTFLDYLQRFRFTGDVYAMPEGTIFFHNEPVLQVIAPIAQAQLIESRIVNLLQYQTMVASKAVRCVLSAPNKLLVDFGMRRAHGAEAALFSSRANYIAGFKGTATVLAGMRYGIPLYGTMSHSYVQSHDSEEEAFYNFAKTHPENVVLLIDSYDTKEGAKKVCQLAPTLQEEGIAIRAVRIDSGDLGADSLMVRDILDSAKLQGVKIFCSGDLDEYKLNELVKQGYPIDGFGVGTKLDTSSDAPFLDCVYKLEEFAGIPRRKKSEGKSTWPGRKQVYRTYKNGIMSRDMVTLYDDCSQEGTALLQPIMKQGLCIKNLPDLNAVNDLVTTQLEKLPGYLKVIEKGKEEYPVQLGEPLCKLLNQME